MHKQLTYMFAFAFAALPAFLCRTVQAQVVQQPSFRTTGYSGTVVVPDRGSALLGGTRYGQSGTVSRGFGPFSNRAGGSSLGGGTMSASVHIIDLKALDQAILSANVERKTASGVVSVDAPRTGARSYLTGLTADRFERAQTGKPAAEDWQRAMHGVPARAQRDTSILTEGQIEADIRYYLRKGKAAEQANRIQSARVFYRMAVEAMTPEMIERYKQILQDRKEAEEELRKKNRPDRIKF